jgi:hypothetical protein
VITLITIISSKRKTGAKWAYSNPVRTRDRKIRGWLSGRLDHCTSRQACNLEFENVVNINSAQKSSIEEQYSICFSISITMADIAEIRLKIKAVEFVLASFTKYRNKEEERVAFLDSQLETVRFLDVYSDFSKAELKEKEKEQQHEKNLLLEKEKEQQHEKNLLLEKENLLLAQQQGRIFM